MEIKRLTLPLTEAQARDLVAGERVLLNGIIYTARDAAHLRLNQALAKNEALPIPISGQLIYYVGPSPARPGRPIGACGPTTSYRMDDLTIPLLELGLKAMMGKGDRSDPVVSAMKKYGAVYLAATGGAGALLATRVKASRVVAFDDLGAEAIHALTVEDFPAVVVIDTQGNNAYAIEREKYSKL